MLLTSSSNSPEKLLPPQAEVFKRGLLDSGFNCVLQMPTGSGKTWLAERAIENTLQQNLRAVYLAPLRALATELKNRWQKKFPSKMVGVFTGDYTHAGKTYPISFQAAQLLIMTPEKLDACTRTWRKHWSWIPQVDLIVVDELHLLGDIRRGASLEGAISRMRRLNPFLRILGLSATMGNRKELAKWLDGIEYGSNWRPVPLKWRFVRFQKATEKPELLFQQVAGTVRNGGKSLVFVQSRRRAEQTSLFLTSRGIRTFHHHAGLGHEERRQVEQKFLSNEADVLVATATLEMGLNLPVRQVVLYDVQRFDGTEFQPLTTNSVWQRVGRAGRLGLDEKAEAVLIIPAWERGAENYEKGKFEPIKSALGNSQALAEQIVAEVSSRMSRTRAQVADTFSRSLAAEQNILPDVKTVVNQMIDAGMLKETKDEESRAAKFVLQTTRLGKIAVRHFLSPATVLLFKNILDATEHLTFFDLLLICACSSDCEPVLPTDYEELESLSENLSERSSVLLKLEREKIADLLKADGKRLLASLKMALVAYDWCSLGESEHVAEKFNCYAFEVVRLKESLIRLLAAMSEIAKRPIELSDETDFVPNFVEKTRLLLAMVDRGLDEYAATLTLINGIGPKLANRLKDAGINDLLELAKTNADSLEKISGISQRRLKIWIREAKKLSYSISASDLFEVELRGKQLMKTALPGVDLYRLRRALELKIKSAEGGNFFVTGGTEPHIVRMIDGEFSCDCLDFRTRNASTDCKHIMAVKLLRSDEKLKQAIKDLEENKANQQINLFDLWFTEQRTFAARRI